MLWRHEIVESKNVLMPRSFSDVHKFHLWKAFKRIRKTTRWKNLLFQAQPFWYSSGNRNRQGPQMACSGSYHLTKPMCSQLIQVPFMVGYEVDTKNPSKLICLSFTFCHLLLSIIWKKNNNFFIFLIPAFSLSFLSACLLSVPSLHLTRATAFGDTSASWKFSQASLPRTPNQHLNTLCFSTTLRSPNLLIDLLLF